MTFSIDLSKKTVLVTGGASGIGYGMACAFLKAGADVIVTAKTQKSLDSCNIETSYGVMKKYLLDVTNDISIDELLNEIDDLDVLINNAGSIKGGIEFRLENFADIVNINLMGVMRVTHACFPKIALKRGCIINISSIFSVFGAAHAPSYSATKSGLIGLTKSMASCWAEHGVRVNGIAPGWINTKLSAPAKEDPDRIKKIMSRIPMGRWGDADEIGGAAVFLASNQASYITGTTIFIDGGYTAN